MLRPAGDSDGSELHSEGKVQPVTTENSGEALKLLTIINLYAFVNYQRFIIIYVDSLFIRIVSINNNAIRNQSSFTLYKYYSTFTSYSYK